MSRSIYEIAREISANWKNINFTARPYLKAMFEIKTLKDTYILDSGKEIVLYFLVNAQTWRGETARRIKEELNLMLKEV